MTSATLLFALSIGVRLAKLSGFNYGPSAKRVTIVFVASMAVLIFTIVVGAVVAIVIVATTTPSPLFASY